MRKIQFKGYGIELPKNTIELKGQIRYRISEGESQISLAVSACEKALKNANITINDIDCIVSASAVGIQPIPCTAALIHEKIAKGTSIPALDINTTCTSFITALDTMSYLVEAGRYERVLIVSCDVASIALNPKQKESFQLFSDGAAAFVIEKTEKEIGVIDAIQKTWSEGAHSTEIRGGLSNFHPKNYSEMTKEEYMFDMNGKTVLSLSISKIPELMKNFLKNNGMKVSDIDMTVPHQASVAMPLIMQKLGIEKDKFLDEVKEFGNMVSASVPITLVHGLENGRIKSGNTILLIGTAAGLTTNMMLIKL
ncbi:3-oxoacyl-[acyl-carrier-protein] synthase III C-terminal domain-containing protein [Leptotrichia sp. oral taxon 879]|uniref:3-oxoacyl-[acyl-carrier-protein] synthase III C-terminal domain-containing protein n=1 Tax=Leptotrichia sp. oral taxon 879 TaxID=1227267 RepID=UPI0003AE652A|nr:3-oxoacyl-[acyl-carrier-protein] synthase III C-terminal domain-containing protein [Leptotrichia sp. oral taxon 879]ERK50231.1 putative 3-oxoacyl-(acyl carrier protein) synthase III [Leptotrichia sp. oral taxon 879 str. F0557]